MRQKLFSKNCIAIFWYKNSHFVKMSYVLKWLRFSGKKNTKNDPKILKNCKLKKLGFIMF